MSKINNLIKINGKSYDATTGAPIQHDSKTKSLRPEHAIAKSVQSHKTQPSKTLRREVLKKPVIYPRQIIKNDSGLTQTKLSVSTIDKSKLRASRTVAKSKYVSRFGSQHLYSTYIPSISDEVSPGPVLNHKLPTPKSGFLSVAIDNATSHQQPLHKLPKSRRRSIVGRIAGVSSVALGVLILVSILGYQNLNNLKIDSASARSGFAASLPARQPSGYTLTNINSNPGEVAINFLNNSDSSRKVTLTEKPSNWDSATLLSNYVSPVSNNYRVVQSKDQTVYILENNSATWVGNGVWYLLTGIQSLSNTQLVDLVSSI
jgi:hypothetical protein